MCFFYKDQGKTKTDIMWSLFESKFWFFNEEFHANTVPEIDHFFPKWSVTLAVIVTDHLTMHFSLPLPISALSCPLPAFTAGCHLHIPASLLISSFSWLGYPLIPQVPGGGLRLRCLRYGGSCMAACIPGISWALQVIAFHPPPMPGHPIATPGYWVDKWKADVVTLLFNIIYWVLLTSRIKSQNANIDFLMPLKSHLLWLSLHSLFSSHTDLSVVGSLDSALPSAWSPYYCNSQIFCRWVRHCSSLCELNTWKALPYWSIHSLLRIF